MKRLEERLEAFKKVTPEEHTKVDAEFREMIHKFTEEHPGFFLIGAMISQPNTTLHLDPMDPHYLIHTSLQLLFGTLQLIPRDSVTDLWDDTIQTAMSFSPEFAVDFALLKRLINRGAEQENDEVCTNCGHSKQDHESDAGINKCWNGSGHGNTCSCLKYEPPTDDEPYGVKGRGSMGSGGGRR